MRRLIVVWSEVTTIVNAIEYLILWGKPVNDAT